MITGYRAYVIYLFTKNKLLKYTSYENLIYSLESKGHWHEKYLKNWNTKRKDKDGVLFMRMEEHHSLKEIAEICFVYWLNNKDFYITDYNEDNGQTLKDFRLCLNSLETILKSDWKKIKQTNNLKYKIFNTSFLINTNISIFSKAILYEIFNIKYGNIQMMDIEKSMFENNILKINKLIEFYPDKFDKKYWINYFKKVIINI